MIELKNVSKAYGGKKVLDGISHRFLENEVSCILGVSGSGKTTLLRLLLGLEKPDTGEICRDGLKFSAVFQEDRLCQGLTAAMNIRLVNENISKEDAAEMLGAVGLEGENDPVRFFSGGMQRRTAILRALAAEYDILVMDEPFKGLDHETYSSVLQYVKKKIRGKTVICVTHSEEEAKAMVGDGGELLLAENGKLVKIEG